MPRSIRVRHQGADLRRSRRRARTRPSLRRRLRRHRRPQQVPPQDERDAGRRQCAHPLHQFPEPGAIGETVASAAEACWSTASTTATAKLTLHATPSALAGYSINNYVFTPTYKSEGGQYTVGLVHLYEYYSQTTTGTGGGAVQGLSCSTRSCVRGGTARRSLVRKYEYTRAQCDPARRRHAQLAIPVLLQFQQFQRRAAAST